MRFHEYISMRRGYVYTIYTGQYDTVHNIDMDFDCKDETPGQGTLIGCGNLTAGGACD